MLGVGIAQPQVKLFISCVSVDILLSFSELRISTTAVLGASFSALLSLLLLLSALTSVVNLTQARAL